MSESPVAIIFSTDGYEATVKNATAIVSGTPAIIAAGSDGTNSRYLSVDTSGRATVVGAGVAGTPAGGVLSIQGVVGGTAVPISGSVTASNASIGTNGSAIPASSTQIGGSDGTNLQAARVFDVDSGAGSQYVLGVNLRRSSSGGSVEIGDATNPIRVDPTGTTTQPVSGTVTVTQSTASNLNASVGGLGASGAALVGNPVRVGGSDGSNTRDILTDTSGRQIVVGAAASGAAAAGNPVLVGGSDGTNARTLKTSTDGTLQVSSTPSRTSTATLTNVAASATSVTLLSSNANRLRATIYNDSTQRLYLKLGATASTTSFTVILFNQGFFTVPDCYTGQIDGIWSAAAGAARITEM